VSVEVGADQRTTVSGESPSLRAVIEEICHQAGVQLRTYAAADRKYVGHLENVPLSQALRSMLRTESYLVGVRSDKASPQERITWLRVLGGEGGTPGAAGVSGAHFARAQPTPAAQPQGDNKFMVSSSLLFQAFGTFDPQRREQAQREILSRIAEPEQMSRFLSSDPKEMAKVMGRYRNSAQTIRQMQGMADRPDVQAKLEEIAAEVERQAQDHP
jgi:hypothetical protein